MKSGRRWGGPAAMSAIAFSFVASLATVGAQPEKKDAPAPPAAAPREFQIEGQYVEACTCHAPCPCELTGVMGGCKGIGAYQFSKGTYDGTDFSGTKLAYAALVGEAVVLYVDAPDAARQAAVEKFGRAAFAAFGTIKAVRKAKVEITGTDGAYTLSVDGGKAIKCQTEPVFGGDKKSPIVHANTNSTLNPTMYQGSCVSCTVDDEAFSFSVPKGRNAYFNAKIKTTGKV